jgi:hypothetical protein
MNNPLPLNDSPFLTEMEAAATAAHEMYKAYIESGFTAEQSLRLVIAIASSQQAGGKSYE